MAAKKTETTPAPTAAQAPPPVVMDRDVERRKTLIADYEARLKEPTTSKRMAKHINRRIDEEKATVQRLSKSK